MIVSRIPISTNRILKHIVLQKKKKKKRESKIAQKPREKKNEPQNSVLLQRQFSTIPWLN